MVAALMRFDDAEILERTRGLALFHKGRNDAIVKDPILTLTTKLMCLPSVTILQYLEEEGARIENHTFQSSSDQCHHRHDQHHEPPTKGGCRGKCSEVEANDSCLSLSRITNEQRTTEQRLVRILPGDRQIWPISMPTHKDLD